MAANTKTTKSVSKSDAEKVIDLRDKTTLVATNAHPYRKEGEEFEIHPNHESDLLAKQWAAKPGGETKATKPAKVKITKNDNPDVNTKG